jgi:acyl-CoA synthetase (NDP forming)
VIGLFMETARRPAGLMAALQKALDKRVPVVVLKVGRTEMSARLAVSHSGAIAGRDDAYQALFDRYGVQRVEDMDEMAATLMMFAQPFEAANGGLVTLHDSGGLRQLLIDLASDMGVALAKLSPETTDRLTALLDAGLPAVNPLDAWGAGGPDADDIMRECLAAMMADPAAAIGAVVQDRGPLSAIVPEYVNYMKRGHEASGKPVFLVSSHQGSGADPLAIAVTRKGFPVLDGMRPFLAGSRCLLNYRDFRARVTDQPPACDARLVERWKTRLAGLDVLDEYQSSQLLSDFGFPMNPSRLAASEAEVLAAAGELGYPLVLKTAVAGILHKTDCDGVRLGLDDESKLMTAYHDLAQRLGPEVIVCPMVTTRRLESGGAEMVLGMIRDEQFGPLVMLGFGGINVETIHDVACALPPFGEATARRLLDSLQLRPLLDGLRNSPAVDTAAFCRAAASFSAMAAALGHVIDEIDINPVIVHPQGCVAVDALVVPRKSTRVD